MFLPLLDRGASLALTEYGIRAPPVFLLISRCMPILFGASDPFHPFLPPFDHNGVLALLGGNHLRIKWEGRLSVGGMWIVALASYRSFI